MDYARELSPNFWAIHIDFLRPGRRVALIYIRCFLRLWLSNRASQVERSRRVSAIIKRFQTCDADQTSTVSCRFYQAEIGSCIELGTLKVIQSIRLHNIWKRTDYLMRSNKLTVSTATALSINHAPFKDHHACSQLDIVTTVDSICICCAKYGRIVTGPLNRYISNQAIR